MLISQQTFQAGPWNDHNVVQGEMADGFGFHLYLDDLSKTENEEEKIGGSLDEASFR